MTKNIAKSILIPILSLIIVQGNAENKPRFTENKGQWPEQVFFKVRVGNSDVFLEKGALTFNFFNPEMTHQHEDGTAHSDAIGHAYRVEFEGSSASMACVASGEQYSDHENFILPGRSIGHVRSYEKVTMTEVYPGVDFEYYGSNGSFKYDVILRPGSDPLQIQMNYVG
ncbi:MAG: hypothetical protein EP314_01435, partial [Bacteroidetes bacterium]